MTQAAVTPYLLYATDGSTLSFPYTWRISLASDLKVYLRLSGDTEPSLVTNYTVTGVGNANGGTIVFAVAPADGGELFLKRQTPLTQLVDYINNDPFGAETHEGALDKLTRIIQDLDERLSRIPLLPTMTATELRNLELPPPGAGQLLGWDAEGEALTLYTVPPAVVPDPEPPDLPDLVLTDFGAVGDGVTDDSAAIQAACDAAHLLQRRLLIPRAPVGYKVNTTINLTNLEYGLCIYGMGIQAPTYGAALVPMAGGSLFLGNTGTGNAVFDCAGSSNILFREINITSLGMSTPSTVGILFGTSTTAEPVQAPGGANCSLENVAIQLQNANNSCPVYYAGGAGNSHFFNVWTLGVYGMYFTANNELALSSDYVTLGPIIGVASVQGMGCNLLGYGGGPPLVLETAHNHRWIGTYIATIFGGPAYVGQDYAMKVENCFDVKAWLAIDYFPTVLIMEGDCRYCEFYGTTFPNETPLDVGDPIIAFFAGAVLRNCTFQIMPHLNAPPIANYHYTTNGVTPTMVAFQSCTFAFDTQSSTFVCYLNATNAVGVPFFNLYFDGDADAGTFATEINGVTAGNSAKRIYINGKEFGTA